MTTFRTPVTIDNLVKHGVAVCRLTHADLTDEDTSQTIVLSTLNTGTGESAVPANSRIMYAWANVLVAFAGGGNSAVVAKLGDAADDDELITDVSIMATGIKPASGTYTLGTFEATAYAPRVTVTTTDGTCAGLTAGVLELCIMYQTIDTVSVAS